MGGIKTEAGASTLIPAAWHRATHSGSELGMKAGFAVPSLCVALATDAGNFITAGAVTCQRNFNSAMPSLNPSQVPADSLEVGFLSALVLWLKHCRRSTTLTQTLGQERSTSDAVKLYGPRLEKT